MTGRSAIGLIRVLGFVPVLVAFACSSGPEGAAPPGTPGKPPSVPGDERPEFDFFADSAPEFATLRDQLVDGWLNASPAWGRGVGLHEHDGRVADYSGAAIERHIGWLDKAITDLSRVDQSVLGPNQRLDLAILLNKAKLERFDLAERELHKSNPRFYTELFEVSGYVDFDYAPLAHRAQKLVEHEEAALKQVQHVLANLKPTLSKPVLEVAIKSLEGYASYLKDDVPPIIRGVRDAAFQARFEAANSALANAAKQIALKLKTDYLPRADLTSHVLGKRRYLEFVAAQEGRALSLDALKKMADANLLENMRAYQTLSKTVTPTRPKASELLSVATAQMNASRRFVLDKDLATIPSEDRCTLKETPPYMRWNAAFLNMPGPFDSAKQAFYYITLPDPSWPAKEQEEYVFPYGTLLATTVHEVYPGHFMHGLWIRKAPTRVQKMVDSYSFTEGWAHYVEEMMLEQGFGADDPQNKLGQLSDALLRNCRFTVSIGVHAEGMSLEKAEQVFVDDCFQDRATARQQAIRATFDPGYFAYTMGKLQILELRAEVRERLGERFVLGRFHDALMSHGAAPVALIREQVLEQLGASNR